MENDGLLKGCCARRRREKLEPLQYATAEELVLSPLPCWKHLPPEEYKRRILKMRDEIEAEAAAARAKAANQPLGRKAILAQHPHHKPETIKKSPKPRIHAAEGGCLGAADGHPNRHALSRRPGYRRPEADIRTHQLRARSCGEPG